MLLLRFFGVGFLYTGIIVGIVVVVLVIIVFGIIILRSGNCDSTRFVITPAPRFLFVVRRLKSEVGVSDLAALILFVSRRTQGTLVY
jgi:uncharacterized protein YggT (Ycf19 family)